MAQLKKTRIDDFYNKGYIRADGRNIHDMYQSTRLADNILDNADAEGKLLYSGDNGATWQLLHAFGHPVFWIALDPNDPNRAYASVIHYNNGAGTGGVYRTDNLLAPGGSIWTPLPDPPRTFMSYVPHVSPEPIRGRIVSVYGSAVVNAAQNQIAPTVIGRQLSRKRLSTACRLSHHTQRKSQPPVLTNTVG